jgi:iron complex transport system substrate-binding protein
MFDRSDTVVVLALVLALAPVAGGVAASPGAAGPSAAQSAAVAPAVAQESCGFPMTRTDATDTDVRVPAEPERVVTLAPSAAQTMWSIAAEQKVVGVTKYASYLEGATNRTNVSGSGPGFADVETVVGLNPDLVLAPDVVSNETVEKLRAAGVTVYKFREPQGLEDVIAQTRLTGRLVGECDGAETVAEDMETRLNEVRETVGDRDRPRVLYVFYGYTAGEGTFIDEILTTAGGTNVAAEAGIDGYAQVSQETVVQQDPEWIVTNSDDPGVPDSEAYASTTAVRQGQTVVVPIEYLNQPAPRTIRAVEQLARSFHAGAFEATPEPTATTRPADAGGPTADTPSTTSSPGFGALPALAALALLGVSLLARRD